MLGVDDYHTANFNLLRILDPDSGFLIAIGQMEARSKSSLIPRIIIDRLISNDQLIEHWEIAIVSDSLFQEYGLLPIGFLFEPVHTRLLLDTRRESNGTIFCDLNEEFRISHNKKVELISTDIWSLIEGCQENINEELLNKYQPKKLVRNWGEDFWRVRKDGEV